jgi:hypothetical protein
MEYKKKIHSLVVEANSLRPRQAGPDTVLSGDQGSSDRGH